jgi:hypothetical protein
VAEAESYYCGHGVLDRLKLDIVLLQMRTAKYHIHLLSAAIILFGSQSVQYGYQSYMQHVFVFYLRKRSGFVIIHIYGHRTS